MPTLVWRGSSLKLMALMLLRCPGATSARGSTRRTPTALYMLVMQVAVLQLMEYLQLVLALQLVIALQLLLLIWHKCHLLRSWLGML